jgi:hypothetical protein
MEPYYTSWKSGAHRDVSCIECHAEPGVAGTVEAKLGGLKQLISYTTGTSRGKLPQGHVSDDNCTGCHSMGEVQDLEVKFQGIEFNHAKHLKDMGAGLKLHCTTCHTQADEEAHIRVSKETCHVCHLYPTDNGLREVKAGGCLACHERKLRGDPALSAKHAVVFDRDISCAQCHGPMNIGASKHVAQERCRNCHFERSVFEAEISTADLHQNHLGDAKVECLDCHAAAEHRPVKLARGKAASDCGACHVSMHEAQRRMFLGAEHETEYVTELPAFHSGLQCQSCHIDEKPVHGNPLLGSAKLTTADSCRACHKDAKEGDFGHLLEKWKKIGDATLVSARAHLRDVEAEVAGAAPGADRDKARATLRWAGQRLALIETGTPMHNIHLARHAFATCAKEAAEAAELAGVADRLPEFRNPTANMPDDCARCHLATNEDIPVEDRHFSHQRHLQQEGISCDTCHAHEDRHGTLSLQKEGCSDCHHGEQHVDLCSKCHQLQDDMYEGRWEPETDARTNLMSHEVRCAECHYIEGETRKVLVRPTGEDCKKCHEDKDVGVLLEDWKRTVRKARERLSRLVTAAQAANADLSVVQRQSLDKAKQVLEDVRSDGSGGIHNPGLTESVLSRHAEVLEKILGR